MTDSVNQAASSPVAAEPPAPGSLTGAQSAEVSAASRGAGKVVVAVHGIGDQYFNATIQTVVSAFGEYAYYPAAIPLGRFPDPRAPTINAFQLTGPPAPDTLGDIGFVEVYWSDIPRAVQKEGYIIEESKAWARTVVERVRARYGECAHGLRSRDPVKKKTLCLDLHHEDYFAGADAIEEMIETFRVLNNLLYIAEKAGVLKFDLDQLLTTYLGDVQIVADFQRYRSCIIARFSNVMSAICSANSKTGIYIVAHSEGTVVALMGLLQAMCHQPVDPPTPRSSKDPRLKLQDNPPSPPDWVKQVRGLMTIGSPIDKHLILWPDIWNPVQIPHPALLAEKEIKKIQWHNYFDYGDPVGFRLDTARKWMEENRWNQLFDFPANHDHGFSRYLLPGEAHNDYWKDEAVFGHFIQTAMRIKSGRRSFAKPPRSRPIKRAACYVIPYFLALGILALGVYLVYKGMVDYIAPPVTAATTARSYLANVAGITALLAGMVALARIPRLTRSWFWLGTAIFVFAAGAALYSKWVTGEVHRWHALKLFDHDGKGTAFITSWFGAGPMVSLKEHGMDGASASAVAIIVLAAIVAGLAAWGSRRDLRNWTWGPFATLRHFFDGARPLIIPGSVCVFGIIAFRAWTDQKGHPLWPLLLASAAFLYLWWLATLLFDLVFVWHRYIRHAVVHNYLFALRKVRKEKEKQHYENS